MRKLLAGMAESTRRAVRTTLQVLGAAAVALVTVAIPPVADAVNAVIAAFGGNWEVSPGLVSSVGLVGAALAGAVAKAQNLVEHRDELPPDVTERVVLYAQEISLLMAKVEELKAALELARQEAVGGTVDKE